MTGYRPIQPAPRNLAPIADKPSSPWTSRAGPDRPLAKPRKQVSLACEACRKFKSKCDAVRPRCGTCTNKDRECQYSEAPKEKAARLESLEQLFEALRTSDQYQASDLLRRIRADQDLASLAASAADNSGQESSPLSEPLTASIHTPCDDVRPFQERVSRDDRSTIFSQPNIKGSLDSNVSSSDKPQQSSVSYFPPEQHPFIPSAELTREAIDGFFHSSGKLFHVFSREQIRHFYNIVYRDPTRPSADDKASLCCLLAAAAVGSQYVVDDIEPVTGVAIYNCARHYLDAVIEAQPLDAIKVCTLLAMHNVLSHVTVGLAYVEIGLTMCRRFGLDCRICQQAGMSQATWMDYRRSWRTLIFLSNWLSATLGYVSGNDVLSSKQAAELELDPAQDLSDMVQNQLVKIAFLKANMLRVHLAFKELTARAIESLMSDMQDWYRQLPQELHLTNISEDTLPLEAKRTLCHMHLLYLGATMLLYRRIASQFALSPELAEGQVAISGQLRSVVARYSKEAIVAAKHSTRILKLLMSSHSVFRRCWLVIFQTHTACLILLHSACQKQLHGLPPATYDDELEKSQICLSVLSFCGKEDIVAQQFYDQLVGFYTAIRSRRPDTAEDQNPVVVVVDADGDSPVADGDADIAWELGDPYTFGANDTAGPDAGGLYLLSLTPPTAGGADPSQAELSRSVLVLLCRPFGDPADRNAAAEAVRGAALDDVRVHWRADPTRYEYPQMIERLAWDFEQRVPCRWDLPGINVSMAAAAGGDGGRKVGDTAMVDGGASDGEPAVPRPGAVRLPEINRFLGSVQPSGWSGERGVMVSEGDGKADG